MFLRRPGGQAQFSAQLAVQFAEREPLSPKLEVKLTMARAG